MGGVGGAGGAGGFCWGGWRVLLGGGLGGWGLGLGGLGVVGGGGVLGGNVLNEVAGGVDEFMLDLGLLAARHALMSN